MKVIKKLPKIYQNTIDKKIKNNETVYYSKNRYSEKEETMDLDSINIFLDNIFNGIGYAFNISVIIKTNTKVYKTSLITRTNNYLLTLDNDKIKISDIISIKYDK